MNIEIANRLVKLRKEHGYSQEQLADKLGVSRQAVSKWERAEASPDTDNLICIARLYNMTLDELLNVNLNQTKVDEVVEENFEENSNKNNEKNGISFDDDGVHIVDGNTEVHCGKNGVHVVDGKKEIHVDKTSINILKANHKKELTIFGIISASLLILVTIIYVILGCYVKRGWEIGWLLFLLVPTIDSLISAIYKRKICNFALPVLIAGIYVAVGMLTSIWHPTWILFLLIPIYYTIGNIIDKKHSSNNPEEFVKDYVNEINENK